ncbi:MAG: SRPBCC family protein [Saprospiraceae bacterium]
MQFSLTILLSLLTMTAFAQTKTPTNKHFWHTVETTAAPEQIWQLWTNVPNWKNWDTGLKDATIEGTFQLNAKGQITSLEGRTSNFKVVEYVAGKSYTFKTSLPFGGLYVKRFYEVKNGKTFFTHEVWFQGLTGGIFAKLFGSNFRKILPEVMKKVKQVAENQSITNNLD